VKRNEMIKERKIFNNIIKNGKFIKNKYYVIYYINNETNKTKFGIAISNKYGKAVERNAIKRKTRAIIDSNRNLFQKNLDYIIMIRKSCENIKSKELNDSFIALLKG